MRTGAEAIWAALEAWGVEHAVGVPGTQNLELWDALRRSRIRPVLTTHELAASFMAVGYYRASGRLAPLVTIPGPGFTYALTGLAEALHDSAAVLHLVGAPPPPGKRFRFQSLEQESIATPVAKCVRRVREPQRIAAAVAEAAALALGGEPGPVVLEWTSEALSGLAGDIAGRPPPSGPPLDEQALERIGGFVRGARRPLILAGQGCVGAAASLRTLAERLGAPVLTSTSGRGVLPEDHPLSLGFEFECGDLHLLNDLIRGCDAVVVIGCKLCEAGTTMFGLELPPERLIHIDASAEVVGANYPVQLGLVARAEEAVPRLAAALERGGPPGALWRGDEIEGWRAKLRAPAAGLEAEPRVLGVRPQTPRALLAALARALPRDAIVVSDCGLHQILLRRHLPVLSPRGLIVPTDFQSMGFGLPAAIGAKLAAPRRPVVAVVGDGGFAMSGLELLTAVREGLPLTVVLFNDGQLNRIRLQQHRSYGQAVGVELLNPDFEALASALGARHALVDGDAEGTFREALAFEGVTVVEVVLRDPRALPVEQLKGVARSVVRRGLRRRFARSLS